MILKINVMRYNDRIGCNIRNFSSTSRNCRLVQFISVGLSLQSTTSPYVKELYSFILLTLLVSRPRPTTTSPKECQTLMAPSHIMLAGVTVMQELVN